MKLSNQQMKQIQQQKKQAQKYKQRHRQQLHNLNESLNMTTQSTDGGYYTKNINFQKTYISLLNNQAQIILSTCLTHSERAKVFRGLNTRMGIDVIVKIILVYKRNIKIYRMILGQAEDYYRWKKNHITDLIQPQEKITVICNSRNTPAFKLPSEEQLYLEFTRPYFSGRSFHEQVYAHSKFPFDTEEMATFIKYALEMLVMDTHEPVFLPTLDNIYFDGVGIVGNFTSFETYMFLRHLSQHLATENFKQLFILLPSDPRVFCEWERMREYMFETIKIKALLVMIFCLCTYRSPVEMVYGQKINEQDLEWLRLVDFSTGQIKEENKIIKIIRNIPNMWRDYLAKPQNKKCLQITSKQIFYQLKHKKYFQKETPKLNSFFQSEYETNYLHNLFEEVFVKEKIIGWNNFFQINKKKQFSQKYHAQHQKPQSDDQYLLGLGPLRELLIESAKDEDAIKRDQEQQQRMQELLKRQKLITKLPEEEYDTRPESESKLNQVISKEIHQKNGKTANLSMNRLDSWEWKRLVAKVGFSYLHKYFMALDIKHRRLDLKRASRFVKTLHFQTYLPLKLSIPLIITLDYQDWFQVFFQQTNEQRPEVYDAAKKLEALIKQKSVEIMQTVKGCEFFHLKRIEYIIVKKLAMMKEETDQLAELTEEVQEFVNEAKPYEHMLEFALNAIKNAQSIEEAKIKSLEQLKMYGGEEYDDIRLILKEYLRIQDMYEGQKSQVRSGDGEERDMEKLIAKVDALKGPAKLRKAFRNMLGQGRIEKITQ